MSTVNGTSNVNNAQANRYQSNISVENRGGKIHLSATGGNDQIKVSNMPNGMVSVRVNNQQLTFTREQAKRLVIHGGAGNDAILNFSNGARLDGGKGNDTIVNFGRRTSMMGGSGNDIMVQFGDSGAMHGNQGADLMVAVGKHNRIYGQRGRDFVADPLGRNAYVSEHHGRTHRHHRRHRSHRRRHLARPMNPLRQIMRSIRDMLVDSKIDQVENQWYQAEFSENKDR